jgi:hypothetical protein
MDIKVALIFLPCKKNHAFRTFFSQTLEIKTLIPSLPTAAHRLRACIQSLTQGS